MSPVDMVNGMLSSPLLTAIFVSILVCCLLAFLLAVCSMFKEELKPCTYGILDILAEVGYILLYIIWSIWAVIKHISYHIKSNFFYDMMSPGCHCCCFGKFKNPFYTWFDDSSLPGRDPWVVLQRDNEDGFGPTKFIAGDVHPHYPVLYLNQSRFNKTASRRDQMDPETHRELKAYHDATARHMPLGVA